MEQGFVFAHTAHSSRRVSHWAAGPPLKSFWLGTKLPEGKLFPIGTWRCTSCGYLESYAKPEFAAK